MSFKTILKEADDSLRSLDKLKLHSEARFSVKSSFSIGAMTPGISRISVPKYSEGIKEVSFQSIRKTMPALGNDCRCTLDEEQGEKSPTPTSAAGPNEQTLAALKAECEELHVKEVTRLRERFDMILQNEQVRTSCLLREAHRERQEKITALKAQLQCKNMAGLMYVLCCERRKSRLERMRLVEEYTEYINRLKDVVLEGQEIMEEMSRGYKTASQVDAEWRNKMKKIVREFQMFLEHYFGSCPESSRFLFDLPTLLKTCSPLVPEPPDRQEDSGAECDCDPCEADVVPEEENNWWNKLEGEGRPFIVFGDMADFQPPQRREVLKKVRQEKPVPEKWQQYAINNKFLLSECPNAGFIKHEYMKHTPLDKNYCDQSQGVQTYDPTYSTVDSRRLTMGSADLGHGPMGSLLKIVTQATSTHPIVNKISILAARDSLELASTTKLKERKKSEAMGDVGLTPSEEMYVDSQRQRKKKTSIAPDIESRIVDEYDGYDTDLDDLKEEPVELDNLEEIKEEILNDDDLDVMSVVSKLGSIHHDSIELVASHSPDRVDKIGYEKMCPAEECQRKHANSFIRSLPPYMDFSSPYREYDRTFDTYEPCTKEDLDKLVARAEAGGASPALDEDLESVDEYGNGVQVQTSAEVMQEGICMCGLGDDERKDVSIIGYPKRNQDCIPKSQLFDENIETNRFRVLGEYDDMETKKTEPDFSTNRAESIVNILRSHPSMLLMFQGRAQC